MMDKLKSIIFLGIVVLLLSSCKYDNYSEPNSRLHGSIVYNGEPINVSANCIEIELWEPGWQKSAPIYMAVDQDGSFSASLFNATYKLIIPAHQGPFRCHTNSLTNSDTIIVEVNGDKDFDIEVEPYYILKNTSFSITGRELTATFGLEQIVTDEDARTIDKVSLYINKTQFVDFQWKVADVSMEGSEIENMSLIEMTLTVPDFIPMQDYIFARVGVKISGKEDLIFSDIQRITL